MSRMLSEARPVTLALLWTALIIVLLSIPGRDIPDVGLVGIDKPAHAILFLIFTLLWTRVFPLRWPAPLLAAAGLGLAFGVASEFYQSVLPFERTPDVYDVVADWIGVLLAAPVAVIVRKRGRKGT